MPAHLPSQLLGEPRRLVVTWDAPPPGVDRGSLTIKAYTDQSQVALPMLLSPEQQQHAMNQFISIVAGPKITRARSAFALVLGMLEQVADKIIVDDSDEVMAGPDGEPLLPPEWVHAFRSITKSRPKDEDTPAAETAGT